MIKPEQLSPETLQSAREAMARMLDLWCAFDKLEKHILQDTGRDVSDDDPALPMDIAGQLASVKDPPDADDEFIRHHLTERLNEIYNRHLGEGI